MRPHRDDQSLLAGGKNRFNSHCLKNWQNLFLLVFLPTSSTVNDFTKNGLQEPVFFLQKILYEGKV